MIEIIKTKTPQNIYLMGANMDDITGRMINDNYTEFYVVRGNNSKFTPERFDAFRSFHTDGYLDVYTDETIGKETKKYIDEGCPNSEPNGVEFLVLENYSGTLYFGCYNKIFGLVASKETAEGFWNGTAEDDASNYIFFIMGENDLVTYRQKIDNMGFDNECI